MHSSSESGEPNLTPMLDMVFQLVTFFMLVINFQAAAVDMSLKLPVVGSARPVDKAAEELLVLNVTTKGDLIVYGQSRDAEQYLQKEAQMAILKLKGKDAKAKLGDELPTMIVIRRRPEIAVRSGQQSLDGMPEERLSEIRFPAR